MLWEILVQRGEDGILPVLPTDDDMSSDMLKKSLNGKGKNGVCMIQCGGRSSFEG